ncbi:hypothetical protein V1514DRAFT_334033 [Lipomyces japonicus]|uniref:uncharacterized protein n=1 Tax=Lipomyces japonicus TaxID=56871 RepID=UPI0034CDC1B3
MGGFTAARLSREPCRLALDHDLIPMINDEIPQFGLYCIVNLVHVVMLQEQNIITIAKAQKLVPALWNMDRQGLDAFKIDPLKGTL